MRVTVEQDVLFPNIPEDKLEAMQQEPVFQRFVSPPSVPPSLPPSFPPSLLHMRMILLAAILCLSCADTSHVHECLHGHSCRPTSAACLMI